MNQQEATTLVRLVKALCPAQAIDDFTADGWQIVLDDITLADATTAVRDIARRPADGPLWIDPRQVLTEVHRIHARRLDTFDAATLTGAPEDPAGYLAWRRRTTQEVAEGRGSHLPQIDPPPDRHASTAILRRLRTAARAALPGKDIDQ